MNTAVRLWCQTGFESDKSTIETEDSKICDDIRVLLKLFTIEDEAGLRVAIALRLEMAEGRGEVVGDIRAKVQQTSGIEDVATFMQGLKSCKDRRVGMVLAESRYSRRGAVISAAAQEGCEVPQ